MLAQQHERHDWVGTAWKGGKRIAATVAFVAALTPYSASAAVICNDDVLPSDTAKAVRVLQSELMVAALACDARHHYGNFVSKYEADLVVQGNKLKDHFETAHGSKKGFAELNRFVTRMANKASGRMASLGPKFCATALETYSQLLSDSGVELDAYSISYTNRIVEAEHGSEGSCGSGKLAVVPNG